MKPLTDAHAGRKTLSSRFWRTILAQQPHVVVPIVGAAFRFFVPGRGRPGRRQVMQAVPVHALNRPSSNSAVRFMPKTCTSSAPNDEAPASETQTGLHVTPRISSILDGHSWMFQWFQSSGNPCTADHVDFVDHALRSQQLDEVRINGRDAAQHDLQLGIRRSHGAGRQFCRLGEDSSSRDRA